MNLKIGLKTLPALFLLSTFLLVLLFYKPSSTKTKRYETILIDSTHLSNETVLILVPSKVELRSEEEVDGKHVFIFFMHHPPTFEQQIQNMHIIYYLCRPATKSIDKKLISLYVLS